MKGSTMNAVPTGFTGGNKAMKPTKTRFKKEETCSISTIK
jgi:hypothetical protein